MAELVLILTDFFSLPASVERAAPPPRLWALETVLARARIDALQPDWRTELALRFAGAALSGLAPAGLVATACLGEPQELGPVTRHWLATPVHYFAGLDSVTLHPAGLLRLSDAEQSVLVQDFARVFADSAWRLRALGQRELLLSGPAIDASAADPAQFVGADPSPGLPRGEGAATLRRLGVEMEMWLHEHRVNLERSRRGELPVSTLWLWGAQGAAQRHLEPTLAMARLYGQDVYAAALWQLRGQSALSLPESFDAAPGTLTENSVVLYPTLIDAGLSAALTRLEQRWLAPALRALRSRRLSGLTVLTGARAYRLRWTSLARLWRARLPWWEALA